MKNRKTPCDACPFGKQAKKKTLGGNVPEVYIGQLHGPFWLPCHQDPNYDNKKSDPAIVGQCAGAAIFRANLGINEAMPAQLNICEADTELSFTSVEEFYKHHMGEDREFSQEEIMEFLDNELKDPRIKMHFKQQIEKMFERK
jgi:hypothetical protein